MSTRTGTCHFASLACAYRYYVVYGLTREDVRRKRLEGEIAIGVPDFKPGQTCGLDEDGRYWVADAPAGKEASK